MTEIPTDLRNISGTTTTTQDRADLEALGLLDGGNDRPAPRPLGPPVGRTAGTTAQGLRRLTDRPDWHTLATPAPIAALWDRVTELATAVRHAEDDVRAVVSEERAETERGVATVRAALDAGKPRPTLTPTDWAAERTTREAVWSATSGQLRDARADYDTAVIAGLTAWRDAVAAKLPELRKAAREAVAAMQPAVTRWRSAVAAAGELERQRDPQRHAAQTEATTQEARHALAGGDTSRLVALLASSDPIVTGSWITAPDEGFTPPRHVRQALNESDNSVQYLAALEAEEGYRHTDFTREHFEGMFPTPDSYRPSSGSYATGV